jgi:hypothetical protein
MQIARNLRIAAEAAAIAADFGTSPASQPTQHP